MRLTTLLALPLILLLWPAHQLCAAAPADPAEPDAFAPLPPGNRLEALLGAARFGSPGADAALQSWLTADPGRSRDDRLRGWRRLCKDYGVLTWNRQRRLACDEQQKLDPAAQGDDDKAMATALADVPPIRAIGSALVPLVWNAFGSQSAEVAVGTVAIPWFVDTGAEISVVSRSLADRIGVRILADRIKVGTSTADVFGEVGVVDLLRIGKASVENVPVLILPDAQLTIGGVRRIDAILGLQVLVAFHRVAWTGGGASLALGETAPRAGPGAAKLFWHEDGLGVPVATALGVRGAHLDTGANTTDWRPAGRALLDSRTLAGAKQRIAHVGGAGGVVEIRQHELPRLSFTLAGTPVALAKVSLVDGPTVGAARIGMDAVSQFGTFILDFDSMRVEARRKSAKERAAPGWRALTAADVKLSPPAGGATPPSP